tara:strand:- start:55 stop:189 length:135 start_codon:yes stop_codon:yes gene_type:complete
MGKLNTDFFKLSLFLKKMNAGIIKVKIKKDLFKNENTHNKSIFL